MIFQTQYRSIMNPFNAKGPKEHPKTTEKFQSSFEGIPRLPQVTTNGLEFAIITEDTVLANGEKIYAPRINEQNPYLLEIYVKASHNFGPELTRPSSGPTRQSLSSYSAIANIDLLIIKHANTIESTYSKNLFAKTKPFHIGKADPLKMVTSNRTICLNSEGRSDLTTDSIRFLTQIKSRFYQLPIRLPAIH